MPSKPHFTKSLFSFLRDLAANNRKNWFEANKERYLCDVREPAQRFINDFSPHLKRISRHFAADPRPVGGSMFRIHRDVRFSREKTPYKTHLGIQFRHIDARNAHTPSFYLHLEPDEVFIATGIWHPDGPTTRRIRERIVSDSSGWKRAVWNADFQDRFEMTGERLKRPPRGFDPDHPLVEDMMWKDFTAFSPLTESDIVRGGFLERFTDLCRIGAPLNRWLCRSLDLSY